MSHVRPRLKSFARICFSLACLGCGRGIGQTQMHAPEMPATLRAAPSPMWHGGKQLARAVRPSAAGGRSQLPAAFLVAAPTGRPERLVPNQESSGTCVGAPESHAMHPLLSLGPRFTPSCNAKYKATVRPRARGLTLPSRGLARAGRATLVRYFPLRAACPCEPLMSHVRSHGSPMKLLAFSLTTLLLLTNGLWVYHEFDQAVTESYRKQERYENANRLIAASTLAEEAVRGKPKKEVDALLRRLFPTEQSFEKEGQLHTIWLAMPLDANGSVVGVAVDPGTRTQAQAAIVGNEVFYPTPPASSSGR